MAKRRKKSACPCAVRTSRPGKIEPLPAGQFAGLGSITGAGLGKARANPFDRAQELFREGLEHLYQKRPCDAGEAFARAELATSQAVRERRVTPHVAETFRSEIADRSARAEGACRNRRGRR